ncbi:MAG: SIMPL domain-containing protein, partial [Aequorivita sp.]|nr:SIMPL domain-containing protein [Aequorivita sp.]
EGVSFSFSNKGNLEDQGRKKAVENAKLKAEECVCVLSQSFGKAVLISEFRNSVGPQPMLYKSTMMADESGGSQQTISPGEMEIRTTVNVSFLLN